MRILVVGGGGREHALCWILHREDPDADLYCAPGNPGTGEIAKNLPIAADDIDRLADAADMYGIDLTVVGPEIPLALGLADRLRAEGRVVFGPSAAAARLESSKAFAKQVMATAGVRTAPSASFSDLQQAMAHIEKHSEPLVVKASGLAGGKGAVVCASRTEAGRAARSMMAGEFGDAGRTVIIESFLEGEEISVLAITDGRDVELLPVSQDHKRLLKGDRGPNTGGMGAYSPVSLATPRLLEQTTRDVLRPTLEAMRRLGSPFTGVLYAGLMVDPNGVCSVVEFNCRLGDPEAEAVLPLISRGFTDCVWRVAKGERPTPVETRRAAAVTTVLAARGYPDRSEKGARVNIPQELPPGVIAFHAGTLRVADGLLRVNGGRVLTVTGVAATFREAQSMSRTAAEAIDYEGKLFRDDIGWREAARVEEREPVTARRG